jgi:hypothetical protein
VQTSEKPTGCRLAQVGKKANDSTGLNAIARQAEVNHQRSIALGFQSKVIGQWSSGRIVARETAIVRFFTIDY